MGCECDNDCEKIPFINIFRRLASRSDHSLHHHAVLVTRGGQVVAKGFNRGYVHAEIQALSKVWPNRRKGCKVWSIRIRKDGRVGMAKPCGPCEAFLRASGVDTVYYSTNDGGIEMMRL